MTCVPVAGYGHDRTGLRGACQRAIGVRMGLLCCMLLQPAVSIS